MRELHIQFFGGFKALLGKDVCEPLQRQPALQALLAYISLFPGQPLLRQQVAFTLWPDTSETRARANLRQALYTLETLLGGELPLEKDYQTITLAARPHLSVDLWIFTDIVETAASDASRLREAIDLYRGEFLPGCYADWILPERERLNLMALAALERLIQIEERQRNYSEAADYARRLLHIDPLHERTYRTLMRLLAVQGEYAAALQVYHTCAAVLERELGVEPDTATKAAYEQLRQLQATGKALPTPPKIPANEVRLVGRLQEWGQIQAIWQAALDGSPKLLLLKGDAGIGKTRLAEEVCAWLNRQGIVVATARCYATEGRLSYGPVTTWLRTSSLRGTLQSLDTLWRSEVARILPELLTDTPELPEPGPLTELWQRQRLFEALARAIFVRRQPTLLLLDDLQWCDRDTLEWIHYLLRTASTPLLVIGTLRPDEISDHQPVAVLLNDLRRSAALTELTLGPLDSEATSELAAQHIGHSLEPDLTVDLYRETEGNPLFVIEMLRAGAFRTRRAETLSDTIPLPSSIQSVIAARLARLSPTAQDVIDLAATIGRDFPFAVLAHAIDKDDVTLVRGLDELCQRQIVREQAPDTYDFSHDKIREVAYGRLTTAHRRLLHRRVAYALEAIHTQHLDAMSGQVAIHYERAGQPLQSILYYERAANAAQRIYANNEAITYLEEAIRLLQSLPPTEALPWGVRLHEQLADLLELTAQHDQARTIYQRASAQALSNDVLAQARLQRKIGTSLRAQHQYLAALQNYIKATYLLEGEPIDHPSQWWQEWVQIRLEQMWAYYWMSQWAQIAPLVEQTQPLLDQYATPSQRVNFSLSVCGMNLRRDRYTVVPQTRTYAECALALAQQSKGMIPVAWPHFMLGFVLLWNNDLDHAEQHLHTSLILAEDTRDASLQGRCLTYLTVLARKRGRIEEVQSYAQQSLHRAMATQMHEYIGTARANMAWVAWRNGMQEQVQNHGQAALAAWQHLPPGHASCAFQWTARWPLIGVALAQRQTATAIHQAGTLWAFEQQRLPDALTTDITAAIAAWEQGDEAAAVSYLQQASSIATTYGYL